MLPPGLKTDWEDNVPWVQTMIIAYNSIRQQEELDMQFEYFRLLAASQKV